MDAATIINNKEKELNFLKHFQQADFNLVDFSFIESLAWQTLNKDDLQQMTERSFWQHDHHIFALRNDFTDQLLRYYSNYPPRHQMRDRLFVITMSIRNWVSNITTLP